uniref:Protein SDA1 n=1 Tax=Parascaris equorum TaxID=6256 RepID=A0A914RV11_PAREQ
MWFSYEVAEIAHLAKIILQHPVFYNFFQYVSTFDIASDAFSTFKELITKHKALCAEFLETNYDKFFESYQNLLNSENYVTRRQSLKLLGELLLDRHNFSRSIQFEAFHVFKVLLLLFVIIQSCCKNIRKNFSLLSLKLSFINITKQAIHFYKM